MPHLTIEYSANLEDDIDLRALVHAMHETAVAIDALPTGGIRTRAVRRDIYEIADGDAENGFINVTLRIAKGRPLEVQQAAGESLFETLTSYVQKAYDIRPIALSFEIQEINPETRWKQGNIRDHMARRAAEQFDN